MGSICSCCWKSSSPQSSETEMRTRDTVGIAHDKTFSIARAMTAPTIDIEQDTKISGTGLALASVTIEQDAAYWEAHVEMEPGATDVWFGVATRKDQKFYRALEGLDEDSPEGKGLSLMRKIKVSDGDTVSVAVQQSDLPMVQFLLNGEPLHDLAINRFRGPIFPALFLPGNTEGRLFVKLIFNESDFKQMSPHARFGPVIVARGII